jgi:rubrerythrin
MTVTLDFSTLDLMDALDMAILIEVEAWERYKTFSEQIGHRYFGDAASIFSYMAENEEKHGTQLRKQRVEMFGDKPVRVSRNDIYDVEAPDHGAVRWNMSPLGAFKLALASEEKAYKFYDDALEYVTDPEVKKLFEELREEEVEHVDLVKKAIADLPAGSDVELEDEDA